MAVLGHLIARLSGVVDAPRPFVVAVATMLAVRAVMVVLDARSLVAAVVAVLLAATARALWRRQAEPDVIWADVLLAAPSIVAATVVVQGGQSGGTLGDRLCVVGGACLTVWAWERLGPTGFAVFPAKRPLQTGGPYAWVRHPAYLGQLIVLVGLLGGAGLSRLWALVVAALLVPRVEREEHLLGDDAKWHDYTDAVRWRLVPGVW